MKKEHTGRHSAAVYLGFCVMMLALGAGDSLRGTLSPVFCGHFRLDAAGFSGIVSASYLGNFLFLLFGGRAMSRFSRKAAVGGCLALWLLAMLSMAWSDSYLLLAVGMGVMMGASTLLNTCMNLTVPQLRPQSSGTWVNLLFFIQGIGTSACQSLAGNMVTEFRQWQVLALLFAVYGIFAAPLLLAPRYPELPAEKSGKDAVRLLRDKRFYGYILVFSLYFVAEHGMMNWYVNGAVAMKWQTQGQAANVTAAFFGAVMVGRMVLSALPDRIGVGRALRLCACCAALLYCVGMILGKNGGACLVLCGFAASILYPTLVMSMALVWGPRAAGRAGGTVLALASIADIVFSACFGPFIQRVGYRAAFYLLPVSMVLCAAAILLLFRGRASEFSQ